MIPAASRSPKDEARRIASNIDKLPSRLGKRSPFTAAASPLPDPKPHVLLTMLCHRLIFPKRDPNVRRGDEMIESRESCYRVAVLSGSLEVSARLKNSDDLELLVKVLEANKVL